MYLHATLSSHFPRHNVSFQSLSASLHSSAGLLFTCSATYSASGPCSCIEHAHRNGIRVSGGAEARWQVREQEHARALHAALAALF